MNASWSMVFGALLAGLVGGFMIPVRPEIRDVPALTASKATEPVTKPAADKTASAPTAAKADDASDVRKIPLTEAASKSAEPKAQAEPNRQADANSCAKETWPYRSPNCLDRTAKVAPADTVVAARRVDPSVSLRDKDTPKAMSVAPEPAPKPVAPTPKTAESTTPKPESAKAEQKVVTTSPARQEGSERPAPQPEQASTSTADEPRAQTANERRETVSSKPRRAARRVNRDRFDDGIPTRIYLRGPDGRLYLAPEYRPSGRTVYFVR